MKRRNDGFTLIELLVVISIIALLIAILLPTLSAARDSARASQCLSNQKQMGIVHAAYQNDNQEWFVYSYRPSGLAAPNQTTWWGNFFMQGGYLTGADIFDCPSFEGEADFSTTDDLGTTPLQPLGNIFTWPEYGYNGSFLNHVNVNAGGSWSGSGSTAVPSYGSRPPIRISGVLQPSNTIVQTDALYAAVHPARNVGYYFAASSFTATGGRPDGRHGDSINILWADSHVDALKVTNLIDPWSSGLTDWANYDPEFWTAVK